MTPAELALDEAALAYARAWEAYAAAYDVWRAAYPDEYAIPSPTPGMRPAFERDVAGLCYAANVTESVLTRAAKDLARERREAAAAASEATP